MNIQNLIFLLRCEGNINRPNNNQMNISFGSIFMVKLRTVSYFQTLIRPFNAGGGRGEGAVSNKNFARMFRLQNSSYFCLG